MSGNADRAATTEKALDEVLGEQLAYYRARASEYDEWFLRRGRYDRGAEQNAQWFSEVDEVRGALDEMLPARWVLELAGGTGLWTERLAARAERVTCLDASTEVLAVNEARLLQSGRDGVVGYQVEDVFDWTPPETYDLVFFGFWLTHVPEERFDGFWRMVGSALAPEGRVFFVDNRETSGARGRVSRAPGIETRELNDGRAFEIVKVFHEPGALEARLDALGFRFDVRATARHFIYAAGGRA